jgi:sensor domain CHASE-containing protein
MTFSFSLVALLLLLTIPFVILWRLSLTPEQDQARRIRQARRVHNLSQEKLAARFGVSRYRVRVSLGMA